MCKKAEPASEGDAGAAFRGRRAAGSFFRKGSLGLRLFPVSEGMETEPACPAPPVFGSECSAFPFSVARKGRVEEPFRGSEMDKDKGFERGCPGLRRGMETEPACPAPPVFGSVCSVFPFSVARKERVEKPPSGGAKWIRMKGLKEAIPGFGGEWKPNRRVRRIPLPDRRAVAIRVSFVGGKEGEVETALRKHWGAAKREAGTGEA